MLASGHNAIGTTVGLIVSQQTQDPVLGISSAVVIAIVLHYLTDAVPHGHFLTFEEYGKLPLTMFGDLFGSFFLFYGLTLWKYQLSPTSLIVLVAIGASQLSDILEGLLYFKKIPYIGLIKWENDLHQKVFHWHGYHRAALPWRLPRDLWQLLVVGLALLYLLFS